MNPFLLQIIIGLSVLLLVMFVFCFLCSVLESTVKRLMSHWYAERLNYHKSLIEPPEQEPIPFGRIEVK
jgi:threonine/homoserine/homoserine lactone efflux protein